MPRRLDCAAASIDRTSSSRFTFDGTRLSTAIRAIRWPRRSWQTACASSAAASSITARAASLTAGSEEPNALVELRTGRPPRAEHPRHRGNRAVRRPESPPARTAGRHLDLTLAVNELGWRRISSAGFYYKTFMWPASFWEKVYEP
jgi:methylglutamate dehydrogenase subunit C